MKRALAVLAMLPGCYAAAFVLAMFFYGMGWGDGPWSWPTVFLVAVWIMGAGVVAYGAVVMAVLAYEYLTDGDR